MGTTYLHAVASLDGYIADERDDVGRCGRAGEVGGQALSLGLIDQVAIDIVPLVFRRGKQYFGTLANGH
jgi:hypothetical protein